jgi:hypothetical protein
MFGNLRPEIIGLVKVMLESGLDGDGTAHDGYEFLNDSLILCRDRPVMQPGIRVLLANVDRCAMFRHSVRTR